MPSILFSSLVLLGVLAAVVVVFAAEPCNHRSYGHESTVCVCDEESCDTLDPIEKSQPGTVQTFSTSQDGDRFAREDLHFVEALLDVDKYMILLHPDQKMQKIIGFGSTITDTSGYNFFKLPDKLQQNLIRDYFGDQGIEYSMLKVPVGSTNMSMRKYTLDDEWDDDFYWQSYKLQPEDLNYKIPFLQMVEQSNGQHRPLKLFSTAWTAPGWMIKFDETGGGGTIKLGPGGKYYKAFAEYLVKFLKDYQEHNITWWGMSILNSPAPDVYDCVNMQAEEQRDFIIQDLGPELHRQGFDKLKLMIFDWNVREMQLYVHILLHEPKASRYVSGIAYHWYTMRDYVRVYLRLVHEEWPDKFLLSTMSSEKFYTDSLGSWHTAEHYANEMIKCMKFYVTGWVDRNLLVDTKGGPSYTSTFLNSPIIVNVTGREYYKQPHFYVLGHFSKFLPEDSVQLKCTASRDLLHDYDLIAFQRPDGGRVMIILNLTINPLNFTIVDPDHGMVKVPVKGKSIKTLLWY